MYIHYLVYWAFATGISTMKIHMVKNPISWLVNTTAEVSQVRNLILPLIISWKFHKLLIMISRLDPIENFRNARMPKSYLQLTLNPSVSHFLHEDHVFPVDAPARGGPE